MKKQKAEISVSMIIGIIIVVVTFGIIAIVYSQLAWQTDIDRGVCKQSAVFRATISDDKLASAVQAKDLFALKCKTKMICVTTNSLKKGECEGIFGKTEGKYSTYRISSEPTKAEEQIKTLLAREMADCWDMLGRGNLAIFDREMTADQKIGAVAIVCSRIHFDKTITGNEKGQLKLQEISGFNYYLLSHKVPNHEVSYWDFLRNAYDGETMALLSGPSVKEMSGDINFLSEKLSLTETKAITFMEVRPTLFGAILGGQIGGVVGAIVGGSVGGLNGMMVGSVGLGALGIEIGDWLDLEKLKGEGKFPAGTSASGIFLTDYNFEGFKKIVPEGSSFEIASYA